MNKTVKLGSKNVELTDIELAYIEQCRNEWGWLDDTMVDLTEFCESKNFPADAYTSIKDDAHRLIRNELEGKGVILFEESRPESQGGDLYSIPAEAEHLFKEA